MAHILVTGGTGLIGCRISEHLVRDGHKVTTFDLMPNADNIAGIAGAINLVAGNICDLAALEKAVSEHRIEKIVHLAAVVSDAADRDPDLTMSVNVGGLANIFRVARAHRLRRVVWASSAAAVGTGKDYDGRMVDEDYAVRPATLYGCSKLAAETLATACRKDGVDCIGIRPALVYGIGRLTGGAGSFNNTVRDVALGRPTTIHSLEKTPLQLMYNRDFARLVARMLDSERRDLDPIYNVPAPEIVSTAEIVATLRAICPAAEIEIKEAPAWQPLPPLLDGAKAAAAFSFQPDYTIETAFREMIAYFRAQTSD